VGGPGPRVVRAARLRDRARPATSAPELRSAGGIFALNQPPVTDINMFISLVSQGTPRPGRSDRRDALDRSSVQAERKADTKG
jgi:hypothetical protein